MKGPVSLLQVQDSLQDGSTSTPVCIRSPTANFRTCQQSRTKVYNQSNVAPCLLTVSGSSLRFESCVDIFLALETRGLPWLKNIMCLERNPSHFNATSTRYDLKLPCILALSLSLFKNPFGFSIQNSARISDFPHSIYVHIATNLNI